MLLMGADGTVSAQSPVDHFGLAEGEAAVVGDQILVKDDHDGHEKLDALIRTVTLGLDGGL